jgi:hypothetical protein
MKKTIDNLLTKAKIYFLLILDRLKREPVLVRTTIGLLIAFGILNISEAQVDKVEQIAMVILVLLGSASARKRVKPLTDEELYEDKKERAIKRIERVQKVKKVVKPQTKKTRGGNK